MLLPLLQNNVLSVAAGIASVSGTLDGSLETQIEAKTYVWTLINETFVATGTGPIGSTANSQALIDSITGSSEWATARAGILVTDLVRTSDTVATLTISAAVQALYDISADDTLISTIPGAVLTGASDIVASGSVSITAFVESTSQPSGGWAAQNWYEIYRQQRESRKEKRKQVIESIEVEGTDAEIAKLLHAKLEHEERDREIAQLQAMLESTYSERQVEQAKKYNERVAKAYVRAATQANFSALEAFEREMERAREEEEFLLIAMAVLN